MFAKKGDWVQIKNTVLPAGQRAPQVPEDTAAKPLEMWVKGFLCADASENDEVTVETMIGRRVEGTLVKKFPGYTHNFGDCVPELLKIHRQVKSMISGDESHE